MKKYKSKILVCLLMVNLFFVNTIFAGNYSPYELKSMDIKSVYSNTLKTRSISEMESVRYEDSYTYEQILNDKLESGLISKIQHDLYLKNQKFEPKMLRSYGTGIRYQKFTFEDYSFDGYVLRPIIYVGLEFDYSGVPKKIVSIDDPHLYTGAGEKCVFGGKIFYRLESYKSIYLGVYGDLYKTANFTISGGGSIGIGKSASVNFNLQYSNNYIRNIDFDRRKVMATPY
ncbi:hypothetical protein [Helcococcus bovis]|uniref:hypothetical protein n=1 Tax=Helcococcus bovis TaxID=3153252 RepID=UPI0038B6ECAC